MHGRVRGCWKKPNQPKTNALGRVWLFALVRCHLKLLIEFCCCFNSQYKNVIAGFVEVVKIDHSKPCLRIPKESVGEHKSAGGSMGAGRFRHLG